jgi:hypothetical protein
MTEASDLTTLIERLEAAMARDGKPRGDHMADGYALMARHAAASSSKQQKELGSTFDLASRCIANETAMFDGLCAVVRDVIAELKAKEASQ